MSDAGVSPPPAEPAVDLDLRLVRSFTVVAEHLNFARAAAALHLAQPSLSRAGDRNPLVAHFVESAKNLLLRDA
ncbi:LysR family transcriptional regulator [Nonomuraea insulae]|uniref:LysR family transcriptional regulator n=1 Tax=Nonomuraea insulae TaxID=1616787 RepID=A0ABW1D929_9ACTN